MSSKIASSGLRLLRKLASTVMAHGIRSASKHKDPDAAGGLTLRVPGGLAGEDGEDREPLYIFFFGQTDTGSHFLGSVSGYSEAAQEPEPTKATMAKSGMKAMVGKRARSSSLPNCFF
jgi:hypothetical protein